MTLEKWIAVHHVAYYCHAITIASHEVVW